MNIYFGLWSFSLLTACRAPIPEGTSIGNPTGLTVSLAESEEIAITEGNISIQDIQIDYEDSEAKFSNLEDFTPSETLYLEVQNGSWNAMTLFFDEPIHLQGILEETKDINIVIELSSLKLTPSDIISFQEGEYLLELGYPDWIYTILKETEFEENIVITEEEYYHLFFSSAVKYGSQLFLDKNSNQLIDSDEREESKATANEGEKFEDEQCLQEATTIYWQCIEDDEATEEDCKTQSEEAYNLCISG